MVKSGRGDWIRTSDPLRPRREGMFRFLWYRGRNESEPCLNPVYTLTELGSLSLTLRSLSQQRLQPVLVRGHVSSGRRNALVTCGFLRFLDVRASLDQ